MCGMYSICMHTLNGMCPPADKMEIEIEHQKKGKKFYVYSDVPHTHTH